MATQTPTRPSASSAGGTSAGRRRHPIRNFLIFALVLTVAGVVGYNVWAGWRNGEPTPAKTNPPDVTASIWERYIAEYESDPQNRPSPDEIRQRSGACLAGLPGTGAYGSENPGYGLTDGLARATAAWVCLDSATEVEDKRCQNPAGTTDFDFRSWARGHLVSFHFGGDGMRRDARNNGCSDIVPQTKSVNAQIREGPEQYGKFERGTGIYYISVPHYGDETGFPDYIFYFIFSQSGPAPGAPLHAWLFINR